MLLWNTWLPTVHSRIMIVDFYFIIDDFFCFIDHYVLSWNKSELKPLSCLFICDPCSVKVSSYRTVHCSKLPFFLHLSSYPNTLILSNQRSPALINPMHYKAGQKKCVHFWCLENVLSKNIGTHWLHHYNVIQLCNVWLHNYNVIQLRNVWLHHYNVI